MHIMLSSINISDRWCSDASNCKFSQKTNLPAFTHRYKVTYIHDMYFSHICHFRPMTQPNPLKTKFFDPFPTQPNPRVNPTHGQLCSDELTLWPWPVTFNFESSWYVAFHEGSCWQQSFLVGSFFVMMVQHQDCRTTRYSKGLPIHPST